ncbi:MAG: 4'-phosphopantetheinyl transferase superfamily protein [Acidobacteriota bacterium]
MSQESTHGEPIDASSSFEVLASPRPENLVLDSGEIHIWSTELEPGDRTVAELERLLTPDEVKRAYRFRFEHHQRRFIVGRGVLRRLLAGYLNQDPRDLRFLYGEKGKPSLPESLGLRFNLSHSETLALYALSCDTELGVDVEQLRPMPDAEQIAERFFSVSERDTLRSIPSERKSEAFFNCWTRKEAYIKATGDGLSMPLDRFDVTLAPEDEPRMLSAEGSTEKAAHWSMRHLNPKPGYVGALAVPLRSYRLRCWEWREG